MPAYWIANRLPRVLSIYSWDTYGSLASRLNQTLVILNIERCYRWWHHVICCEVLGFKLRCEWYPCSSGLLRSVWYCLFTDVLGSVSSRRRIDSIFLEMGPMGCPETSVNNRQHTLWYVVLKLLWICESDFVSKNRSATVPSRMDSRQRREVACLQTWMHCVEKDFFSYRLLGETLRACFADNSNVECVCLSFASNL